MAKFFEIDHEMANLATLIPYTAHYSNMCNDFLRIPDVIVTSHPLLHDFQRYFLVITVCGGLTAELTFQTVNKTCNCPYKRKKIVRGPTKCDATGEVTL